jgi:hypothetical protein
VQQRIVDLREAFDILHHTTQSGTLGFIFHTALELHSTALHQRYDIGTILCGGMLPDLGYDGRCRGTGWKTGQVPECIDGPEHNDQPYDYRH